MTAYMKKPCAHCPFRTDVTPFLHPDRAADIAYISQNEYATFPCHKTIEHDEDGDGYETAKSKECAGMLTMRANELGSEYLPEGFEPSWRNCYSEAWDMIGAYEQQAESEQ